VFATTRDPSRHERLGRASGHHRAIRLAIISDTHMPRGARTVPESCLERCRSADAILHAGDLSDLPVLELLRSLGPPVHAVHGNVDTAAVRAVLSPRLEIAFGGVRIGMVHAPGAASGRLRRLRATFPRCQAVIFGHTHMPEHDEHDGFQIFNPGSPTERRRAPAHTMGLAEVADRAVTFELHVIS
jgi:putative phosphoesterase